jgi:hypothetical protein
MSAQKPLTGILIRLFLSIVILFNALTPSTAAAKSLFSSTTSDNSLEDQKTGDSREAELSSPSDSNSQRDFARPTSRVSQSSAAEENAALQTGTVLLQCDPSSMTWPGFESICDSSTPSISITETFYSNAGIQASATGDVRFKLVCEGGNCTTQDIYYRAIMDGTFQTTSTFGSCIGSPPCHWKARLYNDIHFTEHIIQGTQDGVCGTTPSGTCRFEILGVIPKEIISPNSADWNNNYFNIHAEINDCNLDNECASWESMDINATVYVSFDPRLLNLPVPPESANCKEGCNYGSSQGWAADPINTSTGALSYSVEDLEISTTAGPLNFTRTYISTVVNKFIGFITKIFVLSSLRPMNLALYMLKIQAAIFTDFGIPNIPRRGQKGLPHMRDIRQH